jgi:hyperosmotically inducible protein
MKTTMRKTGAWVLAAALAGALLSLPQVSNAATGAGARSSGAIAQPQQESLAARNAAARLNKKQFSNVKVTVENGVATLTGTVDFYEYKRDAEDRVLHAKGVTAARNEIQVAGPGISDAKLQAKLARALAYNRVGYGNVFDAITVRVNDGVVTLGGHAHDYKNRNSALALVATTHGVKGMVDGISVDPTSQMDSQIRIEVARAIYGFPALRKYDLDPQRPIRISVQNGDVALYGTVDSQTDKQLAYMRANGVPGVFRVKNDLYVAGQPNEKSK